MRTKGEESSMTSNARASNSPDTPSTAGSASPPIQRSEIRCLQDLGDLQQLHMISYEIWADKDDELFWEMNEFLDKALRNAEQEMMTWARQHEADGRYRDAEYLIRRANSGSHGKDSLEHTWSHLSEDVLPTMVSIYEKMGDYTAAEVCQEKLVKQLFAKTPGISNFEKQILDQSHAVTDLSRLLSNFKKRILDLAPEFGENPPPYEDVPITYRAAVLDISSLNDSLLVQGLIPLAPREEKFCTSFHVAAKENAINLARQLIEMGADVNSEDWKYRTPLHIAATYAGFEMTDLLLDNKAQVEVVDALGHTPVHAAVLGKRPQDTVPYLINAKAKVNTRTPFGHTALDLAIERDLPAIASLLLEQGANVEMSGLGEAPLFTALHHQRTWAIYLLLDNGANLLEKNGEGYNVLEVAVRMNRESIVQVLLDRIEKQRSASYEENEYEGSLTLPDAIEEANVPIVKMLLKARVGIHARDHNGDTALHRAIIRGSELDERIVQLFLEYSADGIGRANGYGDTALHLAVEFGCRKMLVILLRHKPHELPVLCQVRNSGGRTPLDIARALAKGKEDPSVEISVLYLLENALELSHSFINNTTAHGN